MAESIKLKDNTYIDASGIYDSNLHKTQQELNTAYCCDVYYSGTTGVQFTGAIKFNTIRKNIGNCYSTSTGAFTCPVNGIYIAVFQFYSGSTATNQRPSIMVNGSNWAMTDGAYGHSVVLISYFTAGTKLTAGAYDSRFPITTYGQVAHNGFMVTLLKEI